MHKYAHLMHTCQGEFQKSRHRFVGRGSQRSAEIIASYISGVGFVTVSLRKSIIVAP